MKISFSNLWDDYKLKVLYNFINIRLKWLYRIELIICLFGVNFISFSYFVEKKKDKKSTKKINFSILNFMLTLVF